MNAKGVESALGAAIKIRKEPRTEKKSKGVLNAKLLPR
jgi:hypothetical protein